MTWSRRDFLRRTCCTAAAGFAAASFNRFGLVNALAQTTQDYKALVCIFLFGGNDSNNMVVPIDSSGYASYKSIRSVLALPQGNLLPISPPSVGSPFGFHPNLPEVQSLFNSKQLAVLANVGTLIAPTTRAAFQQGQATLPQNLFSHSDQQAQMQTASLNNSLQTGQEFDWYPALFTPGQTSSQTTGQTGFVYYARGLWNSAPHELFRRAFAFSKRGPS